MTNNATHRLSTLGTVASISSILAAGLLLSPSSTHMARADLQTAKQSVDPEAGETKAHRDARMKWFREARFGMFIHWGLYAVPAGTYHGKQIGGIGEWIMNTAKIPVAEYAEYAKQFDPEQFNADEWVSIAKAAGMKYIVITAKHHDGFAMFHTATDGYNIYDATPFKRDPIAELAAACKRQKIKFGVYYSQAQDWHHAGGAAYGGHWDKAQDGDLHEYVRTIAAPQVRELLTKYHPSVLWWDTAVEMSPDDIKALTAAFPDDPGLIANNRLGNGVPGDTETPEQFVPATGYPGRDWETCMTINDTWGYKSYDTNFKSTETLAHNLIDIASKGGNYLLNVGPTDKGIIPAPEVERLKQIGAWMKVNGAAIYGTQPSPFKRLAFDGRVTRKGNTLYLHVFSWPDARAIKLTGLETPVHDARALETKQRLTVTQTADGTVTIAKPDKIDPIATVIELRLKGDPKVTVASTATAAETDGSYQLKAGDADINGSAQVEQHDGIDNIGYWTDASTVVVWTLKVPEAAVGDYRVEVEYACDPGSAGSAYSVSANDKTAKGAVEDTGAWQTYRKAVLDGVVSLASPTTKVKVAATSMPHGAVMNLRKIVLTPVKADK